MSNSLFDDLARTLATPMPRRRALQLAAGLVVAAAVPGARARPARAGLTRGAGKCPPGGQQTCAEQFGKEVSECCSRPIPGSGNYTCCPPGECFYSPTTNTCCPPAYQCRGAKNVDCCNDGERCVDGDCERCPADQVCGKKCCEDSEVCVNSKTSLCCVKTWKQCKAGLAGVVKCCPPLDTCCFNKKTKTAVCCDAKHPCLEDEGRCKCMKGETPCAGKCCPKGQVCSAGECCPTARQCGDVCCGKNEFCASSIAYSKPKVCCTSNRIIVMPSGKPVCCPKGTVPNDSDTGCCPPGDPNCCGGGGDDELSCLGNRICVRGICQKVS